MQLYAAQNVGGQGRVDVEELWHVVTRQLHDVLLHRERDDGAVCRPCERVAIPRERLILDGDVVVAVAFLEVRDEALGQGAVAPSCLLVEDVVDVGDNHEVAVHVRVLHEPGPRHREGLGHACLDEAFVTILLPLVARSSFSRDRELDGVLVHAEFEVLRRLELLQVCLLIARVPCRQQGSEACGDLDAR